MNKEKIVNLLRKIITSLTCIEKITKDEELKKEAEGYIIELSIQYNKIINKNDINITLNKDDLVTFSYECINNKECDFVKLGEDIQFGTLELIDLLNDIK